MILSPVPVFCFIGIASYETKNAPRGCALARSRNMSQATARDAGCAKAHSCFIGNYWNTTGSSSSSVRSTIYGYDGSSPVGSLLSGPFNSVLTMIELSVRYTSGTVML